jgi:hypothetical protein
VNALSYAGYIIALIGTILIIILSLLDIIVSPFLLFTPIVALGALARGIVGLIIGIVCAIGAKYVSHVGWAIVLIILG